MKGMNQERLSKFTPELWEQVLGQRANVWWDWKWSRREVKGQVLLKTSAAKHFAKQSYHLRIYMLSFKKPLVEEIQIVLQYKKYNMKINTHMQLNINFIWIWNKVMHIFYSWTKGILVSLLCAKPFKTDLWV